VRAGAPLSYASMQHEADATNCARLGMLEAVISEHILIPPKFARYPEVEEVLWRTVQHAIAGEIEIDNALRQMREQISEIVPGGVDEAKKTKRWMI